MKLRGICAAVLCAAALTIPCSAIDLVVDGQTLALDVPPQVVEQRTLVPLRAIFEELGAAVTWDQATQTATATDGANEVRITLDSTTAYVNGEARALDVPAMAVDGRTLVPARFVAEALQAQVEWDQEAQAVRITTAGAQTAADPAPAPSQPVERTVYITQTGSRYHYDSSCNGGTYYESTLEEAQALGLTPCQKCVE